MVPTRLAYQQLMPMLLGLLLASSAQGQTYQAVGPRESCPSCQIRLDQIGELTADDSVPALMTMTKLATGPSGGYLLAPLAEEGAYIAVSSSGRLRGLTARPGNGPGELNGLRQVRLYRGDTLLLVTNRLSLAVHDSVIVARAPVAQPWDVVVLDDGSIVMNAPGGGVHTIQRWAPGLEAAIVIDDASSFVKRPYLPGVLRLSPSRGGGFWTAPVNSYRFTRRGRDGSVTARLLRNANWFPDWSAQDERRSSTPEGPRLPRVMGLREDSLGRLWVLSNVPTGRLAGGGRTGTGREPTVMPGVNSWSIEYYSVLEVIDPTTGTLIKRFHSPVLLSAFISADRVYGFLELPDGSIAIRVFRVSLSEPPLRR